jgi:hypothetical protein
MSRITEASYLIYLILLPGQNCKRYGTAVMHLSLSSTQTHRVNKQIIFIKILFYLRLLQLTQI